ncbi:hypothetical protein HZS_5460 [Henneguya salminicola]|nr:hypothetical protein HZS_5460 [Henneguya salminicola]
MSNPIQTGFLKEEDFDEYRTELSNLNRFAILQNTARKNCKKINLKKIFQFFVSIFPIFTWIREYKWKSYLKHDIICGSTLGIMQIPQGLLKYFYFLGLAYARLALLPPMSGLYVSFITPLIYMITGTSKPLSIGTFSVISLMVGTVVSSGISEKYIKNYVSNSSLSSGAFTIQDANFIVVSTLTFLVGGIQIILSFLKVGFISNFFSSTSTRAFIVGSACLVFTSQFQYLIGVIPINITPTFSNFLNVGLIPNNQTYITVFSNIVKINFVELIIAVISIVLSMAFKYLSALLEKKTKLSFPSELIIIIIADAVSYLCQLQNRYNIRTELFAYGSCNFFSSFFFCFVCGGSLSRSVIASKIGRTQSTLSAIIVVALIGVFRQAAEIKSIWKDSLYEAFVWIITFIGTVIFGITIGPNFSFLGECNNTNAYKEKQYFKQLKYDPNIRIFQFKGPIIYINKLLFSRQVTKIFTQLVCIILKRYFFLPCLPILMNVV